MIRQPRGWFDACQRPNCWGHDVLPDIEHYHVREPDRPWEDWIRSIDGEVETCQLELPFSA